MSFIYKLICTDLHKIFQNDSNLLQVPKYLLFKNLYGRPLWYPLIVLNELICSLKFNPEPFIARHPKCTYICVGEYSNRTIWHVNMPAALWCFKESDILTKSECIFIISFFKQTQQKSIQHFLKFLYVFSVRYLSWPKLNIITS